MERSEIRGQHRRICGPGDPAFRFAPCGLRTTSIRARPCEPRDLVRAQAGGGAGVDAALDAVAEAVAVGWVGWNLHRSKARRDHGAARWPVGMEIRRQAWDGHRLR